MTEHKEHNPGHVDYFLGHGTACTARPIRLIRKEAWEIVSIGSENEPQRGYLLYLDTHKAVLKLLVDIAQGCAENVTDSSEVISKYINLISTAAPYVQYVANRFMITHNPKDVLQEGHNITVNGYTYDLRTFEIRNFLLTQKQSTLPEAHVKVIQKLQKEYMGYNPTQQMHSKEDHCIWEIRERIVTYPYDLGAYEDTNVVPPESSYFTLSYKFEKIKDYFGHTQKSVFIKVFLSKAAIQYDMARLEASAEISTYVNIRGAVKSGELSGKHLIFMHLECKKPNCDDSSAQCEQHQFSMSSLLQSFISKLSIKIKKIAYGQTDNKLLTRFIELCTEEELGTHTILPASSDQREYGNYILTSSPHAILVMGACTGQDALLESIFTP